MKILHSKKLLLSHCIKNLLLIFTLLVSTVFFSSPSYSEWTRMRGNASGMNFYLDFGRIRKIDGYVYWYDLIDLFKPDKYGDTLPHPFDQPDILPTKCCLRKS